MKPTVLLLAVLGCAIASPNGYYHQEYNYKTSSSAYKNNELQHQTDDQGYYRKDGDLEGRVKPRIDANSEHSEYVNPNLRTGEYNTGMVGGANGDMSSYGHMRADVGSYGHDMSSEGLAHADRIVGNRGGAYQGYTSGSYGSNSYGSSSQSYGMSSNLRSVTSNIRQDLERDLQQAIQDNRGYAQSSTSFSELERELRQNLTNRLNAELSNRYGQQSVRGGLSYTISDGRLQSTANYDNQELQDLRRQLENTLLNQLRSQYYQSSSSSSRYETQQSSHGGYGYSSTVRPAYYNHQYPVAYGPVTTVRPVYTADYTRYTPISNPQSITNIASRVQNQLDTRLNQILEDVQRRYFSSSSSYSLTNADVVLENLRNELRNNITYLLNEDVKANYGNQILRDGYMYSVGPNGQTSTQNNYSVRDLENLRSQIERNLIEKLNRDFETYRTRWNQQSAYSSQSSRSSNVQYSGYNTPRYDTYSTPRYETYSTYTTPRYVYSTPQYRSYDSDVENLSTRPAASHITPLITSGGGSSSSSSSDRHYSLLAGSRQAGYEISGSSSNIGQLQRQLQSDLSRQLQAAISRSQYGSYSSSGSYNPQSYQLSLQQLSDELNRNLTRQLQEYSASGYYSSYGNFDQSQLASLRSQLQADLMRQLQQGLQQSYQSSSSYSASSSSSSSSSNGNYRPARGFDNYQQGQYRSGGGILTMGGADCAGDDPNAYTDSHRMKRSYQPYRSQHIGFSYTGTPNHDRGYQPYNSYGQNNYRPSHNPNQQQLGQQQVEEEPELGQLVDESDLTQQVQDPDLGKLQLGSDSQQVEQNQQQLENVPSGKLQLSLGQEVDDSDVTQQVQDPKFGRLELVGQSQQVDQNQLTDSSDSTQQVEDSNFGRLQLGGQNQQQIGHNRPIDRSDSTQQVEDSGFGRLQLVGQGQLQTDQGQLVDNSDLTQQVQNPEFGRLELVGQNQQVDQNQLTDNSPLTQQVEDPGYGRLQLVGQSQQQTDQGQLVDNSDVTQQVQDPEFGRLELVGQSQQGEEDSNFGRLEPVGQTQQQIDQGQSVDNSDLTQQVQDPEYGRLELVGQSQQEEDSEFGRLHLVGPNQQQTDHNRPIGRGDLGQVTEDNRPGNGKFELIPQNPQQTGDAQQKPTQLGQEEDDSDLTQQQTDDGQSSGIHIGSSTNPQGGGVGGVSTQGQWRATYKLSGFRPTSQYLILGMRYNGSQKIKVREIETELWEKLNQAVRNYYLRSSGSDDFQLIYDNILLELEVYLRQQLQALVPKSSNSRYVAFQLTAEQAVEVEQQLGDLLKIKLEQEISKIAEKYSRQATTENSLLNQHQQNSFGSNLNTRQEQTVHRIEADLSKQLQDAVRNYYVTYSGSVDFQSTYQDILRELQRNLTQQLQALGPNSGNTRYSYTVTFSGPQVQLLREQLENELKVQLQREISNTATTNSNSQQTNFGVYPQNSDNQEISPIEKIVQQPIDTDQQNKEDINVQLPERQVDGNQPNSNPFESSNLQFATSPPPGFVGFNFNEKQRQTAHRIIIELSKQLRDDVKNYISTSGSVDYQTIYQDKLRELQRNITRQLQAVSPSSIGYTHEIIFSGRQLELLKRQLETDLEFQLQQAISTSAGINFKPQQINQYPQNNLTPENQERQPIQTIVQQPTNNDDQNQEVENGQLPDGYVDSNRPNYTPYASGNLQFGNRPTYEYFGSNFNENQKQTVQQIETDLSDQIKDAVKNYYITYSGSVDYQSTFQNILRELQRNLTSELQNVGPNSRYSYRVVFSGPQVQLLQKQLENQLQLHLQQEISNAAGQTQGIVQQQTNTDQQNQEVEGINTQVPYYSNQPGRSPYASGSLQLGNRPISQTPTNNFLQTEINQQQNAYPYWQNTNQQNNLNQRPNNLPTLNQVIQQQQNQIELKTTTEGDVNQQEQTVDNQGQYTDVPSQNQWTNNQNPTIPGEQTQYGRINQGSYLYQNTLHQHTQQTNIDQDSSQTQLTQGQLQIENQLENDLSKQLQDAISQNRFTFTYTTSGTINPETYQQNYQQILQELQRNITKQIEEQLNSGGQSSYSRRYGFTQEQKDKLVRDLVADLSSQLQQLLETRYIHYNNRRPTTSDLHTHPSQEPGDISGSLRLTVNHGSSGTTNQLNYGQQEVVPEFESVEPIQPIEPISPSVVQNVNPQASQNLGVKGHGRLQRPVTYNNPQVSQSENFVNSASASEPTHDEDIFKTDVELIASGRPSSGTQEITTQDETQQNLPWYKRFHNKVRDGVTSLKEKIIG